MGHFNMGNRNILYIKNGSLNRIALKTMNYWEVKKMNREELKEHIDELMKQYADEEIDGDTYAQKMIELTTSAQSDED